MVNRISIVVAVVLSVVVSSATRAQEKRGSQQEKPQTQPAQQHQQPPAQPNGDRLSVTEHEIKLAEPRFTGRAIKNITDAIKMRAIKIVLAGESTCIRVVYKRPKSKRRV